MPRDYIARAANMSLEPPLSYTMCLVQARVLCEHDKEFCYGDHTTGIFICIPNIF